MGGVNYGGYGDGTPWSSERGDGPAPGGGTGTGGAGGNGEKNQGGQSSPAQRQISAIQNDPVIRQRLSNLIKAAVAINYAAKLQIESLDHNGKMSIAIDGLTADQVSQIGLGGFIMGFNTAGGSIAIGDFETGHKLEGGFTPQPGNGGNQLAGFNDELTSEASYQANFRSMIERARQLAQSQSVGAANTEELRANFIRDRASFRPAELEAINAELDRATIAETNYQANYRSMLERANQLAQSQSVGAANTEELRATFIRDRAAFRPADLEAINAELDRATIAEIGYQANYRSMLERAHQLAQSQSVGAANTEQLRESFIRDRAAFRPADLEAINAELDRATIAEIGYQANYRSMLERARQLAQSQAYGALNTEELRASFIRDRAAFRPSDLDAINAELDRATKEEEQRSIQEALTSTSELISDVGEKVSGLLGEKYKAVANEIAGDIRNFQGKTIRNHNDAMVSLNKVLSNPAMKISKGDADALANAWRQVNASDMANKLSNMARAFKVADVALKVESVREKSIEGYETGNWKPLMLEVESWAVSGIVASLAIGVLGSIVSTFLVAGTLPATATMIAGILLISILASLIDDKVVDKINNDIIRPAN
ncbi:colicin-like pore-forming protein [Yokenella regensburgei]|uniref:colicin-like pore-forming protein n=1 Tax=Yokenella regensburgei TaxID=158877 RepID=UPI003ED8E6CB